MLKRNVLRMPPGSGIGSAVCILVTSLSSVRAAQRAKPTVRLPYMEVDMSSASVPVKLFFAHVIDTRQQPYGTEVRLVVKPSTLGGPLEDGDVDLMKEFVGGKNVYHECTDEDHESFACLWKLRPWCLQALRDTVCVDVCFNIRRGDKVSLEPHLKCTPVVEYVQYVESNVSGPDLKMWHTSDDYTTYEELRELRPEWTVGTFCTPQERGYFLAHLNDSSQVKQGDVLMHVIKFAHELFVMSSSTLFVGTSSTSVGFLAKLLREQRARVNGHVNTDRTRRTILL